MMEVQQPSTKELIAAIERVQDGAELIQQHLSDLRDSLNILEAGADAYSTSRVGDMLRHVKKATSSIDSTSTVMFMALGVAREDLGEG